MLIAGTRTRWDVSHSSSENDEEAQSINQLAQACGLPRLVTHLLWHREIQNKQAAQAFLKPELKAMHDPCLLPGAEKAAQRITQAVHDQQPIVIYGDYDVDGVTAASILWHVLVTIDASVACYVPHRIDEGYGLNIEALDAIANRQAELISQVGSWDLDRPPLVVSVDCGITATAAANHAKEIGLDLIITDHHELDPNDLPNALALVHPRLPESPYPFGDLCGAGVAFKLAWQIARVASEENGKLPKKLHDVIYNMVSLAALGTVADIVPLQDENRVITTFGLHRMRGLKLPGLRALLAATNLLDQSVDAYHVGFVLGPRLNACGRMGHAREAVRLMTTDDSNEAQNLAAYLTQANETRKQTEREVFAQAKAMVEEQGGISDDRRAIVLAKEGWHPGVLGIVASRMVETFGRPAVLMHIDGITVQGSGRSVDDVCLHTALTQCSHLLQKFGGHAMAAGLTLAKDDLPAFRQAFTEQINTVLDASSLTPVIRIDANIELSLCQVEIFEQLEKLAPFGRSNPTPRLRLERVTLDRSPSLMGKEGQHLQVWLRQGQTLQRAVAFGMGELCERLWAGQEIDVVFRPKISTWRGQRQVDLIIEDFAYHTETGLEPLPDPNAASPIHKT